MDYDGADVDAAELEASDEADALEGGLGDGFRRRKEVSPIEHEDLGLVRTVGPRAY
jgi:hypothetical protein